ncbi:MAG: hypothetical protein HQM12_02350 [SAR324 cluster bacterium]|nr:hypothetical protein [SAR324 cluster bacterium]
MRPISVFVPVILFLLVTGIFQRSVVSANEVRTSHESGVHAGISGTQPSNKKGGTYFTDTAPDLDRELEREETKDAVGEFVIVVDGERPAEKATLSIYAFDTDEERGEEVRIYLNDHLAGRLSGTDNTWNTTVFDLDPAWVVEGENRVRFVIGDSRSRNIKWTGTLGWGQLLIDGGAGDQGQIIAQNISTATEGKMIRLGLNTSLKALINGNFRIEYSLMDPDKNALEGAIEDIALTQDETRELPTRNLNYDKSLPSGTYELVSSLFYQDETTGMWIQQQSMRRPIEHIKDQGVPIPAPAKDQGVPIPAPAPAEMAPAEPGIGYVSIYLGSQTYLSTTVTYAELSGGMELDFLLNGLAVELAYGQNLSAHSTEETESGVSYDQEQDVKFLNLYGVYQLRDYQPSWLQIRLKGGISMLTLNQNVSGYDTTLLEKDGSSDKSSTVVSTALEFSYPLQSSMRASLQLEKLSSNLTQMGLGFSYHFR